MFGRTRDLDGRESILREELVINMQEEENADSARLRPQYPGDDTRPTSRKELAGWYSYGWAAEVFTVCAMGTSPPQAILLVLLVVFFVHL